ncbi:hypothetical protein ALNOE001_21430 [Candidatus Methanobinarius endosymbioticus]|uniref:Uncharacterized protein n=1 Tax=Candidatus Methanobinarius endosymbioticus TaxID=2006182 RepID=A0A366M873_9EURY|nr:hypothetical protein ALNOE001_21430 [Candidatus Methanobinarius endosymbioticus]
MKEIKKILILLILFIAAAGFTLSTVSAVEGAKLKTKTVKFKDNGQIDSVKVGSKTQDKIYYFYCSKNHDHESDVGFLGKQTGIAMNIHYHYPSKYHLQKAKITFIKKVNG